MVIKLCNEVPNRIKDLDKYKFFLKGIEILFVTEYILFSGGIYVMFFFVEKGPAAEATDAPQP
jgi:hypothetical protein